MSTETITLEVSQDLLAALKMGVHDLADNLRLTAALSFYTEKKLSLGKAAELAGMNRLAFMDLLATKGIVTFDYDASALTTDLAGIGHLPSDALKLSATPHPLIAFAKIAQLQLMQQIVGQLIIPDAVAMEISAYTPSGPGAIILADEPWIEIKPLQSDTQLKLLLPTLDRGEAAVIALALERNADLVLMDELTGRKVAESLQLKVTGSVGLLIKAKQSWSNRIGSALSTGYAEGRTLF